MIDGLLGDGAVVVPIHAVEHLVDPPHVQIASLVAHVVDDVGAVQATCALEID